MSKTLVIYHSADYDGIFCREIAKKFLGEKDVEYKGWNFGDELIDIESYETVYILDLSPECILCHDDLNNVIWIDHHKTSIEKWPEGIEGYRIDGVAACRLAWQWFDNKIARDVMSDKGYLPTKEDYIHRRVSEPYAIQLAGEYDIWDKRNPDCEIFQYGLRCYIPKENEDRFWYELFHQDYTIKIVREILRQGGIAQKYEEQNNASLVKTKSYEIHWHGLNFLVLNTARCNSLTFKAGIKEHHDGLIGYFYNGKHFTVSLYGIPSKPDIDLSQIALKYGGGGHKQACGFTCKELPFK